MKISYALLRKGLSGLLDLPEGQFCGSEFVLNPPRFLDEEEEFVENRLCFWSGSLENLPSSVPQGSVLFVPGLAPNAILHPGIIPIPDTLSVQTVFNAITGIFEHCDDLAERLTGMIDRRDQAELLLDLGAKELGNPLYIHNAEFEIIATCRDNPFADPEKRNQIVSALSRDPYYKKVARTDGFFNVPASVSEYSVLCCNSFSGKQDYDYRIAAVDSDRPFTDADESMFRFLCGYIRKAMQMPHEQRRISRGTTDAAELRKIFAEALTQDSPDYSRLARQLAGYGWKSDSRYCVMVCHMAEGYGSEHSADLLPQQLERRFPHSCAVQVDRRVMIVLNLTMNERGLEDLIHDSVYFLRDNFLKLGISNPSVSLSELQTCYAQASLALEYIRSGNSFAWRMQFKDMALSYILDNCTGQLDVRSVCSPKLVELRDYDAGHNTDFYTTLRTYIDCHFNALETTRRLYIHRSTFLYRLERIRNLFAIDLDDPDELLHIMISMRLLDKSGKRG